MKLLTVDIETSPAIVFAWGIHDQHLNAGQIIEPSRVLCWAAKWYDSKTMMFSSEFHDNHDDMIFRLWKLLDEADAVISYNGKSFDVKHINREFLLAGLGPPSPYANIDLYQTVRSNFKFLSSKLDSVAQALDIGGKAAHEGFGLWKKCLEWDPKAWGRMKRYNIQDVRLTEDLYEVLRPWIKNHPSVNLVSGESFACPTCGSVNLTKRGTHNTRISSYQRFQCSDCGSYSHSGKALVAVEVR